jgi:hypothetical protein
MTYIEDARNALLAVYPDEVESAEDARLIDLYTLLVLVRGEETTLEDVHEAWAVWRSRTRPDHPSIVPFEELEKDVQEMDRPYVEAIRAAAKQLRGGGAPRYFDRKWKELA